MKTSCRKSLSRTQPEQSRVRVYYYYYSSVYFIPTFGVAGVVVGLLYTDFAQLILFKCKYSRSCRILFVDMPPNLKNSKKAETATVPVGARIYFLDKSGSWEPGVLENVHGTKASCRPTTQAWNTNSQSTANTTVPYDVDHVLAASVSAPEGIEDMTNLDVLHEGALQENVASRYFRDEIYTFVGPILVSVNPYVMLPIYTHELRQGYRAGMLKRPHLYAVADRAYVNLETDGVPQSVLISGESGAGKTEATKIVLAYLTTRATAGALPTGYNSDFSTLVILLILGQIW